MCIAGVLDTLLGGVDSVRRVDECTDGVDAAFGGFVEEFAGNANGRLWVEFLICHADQINRIHTAIATPDPAPPDPHTPPWAVRA
ncbi:hypothetical protein B7R54_18735 [Subtercola boreus]|uniref:Uncharacterized protein n=1 Tax=Subtercola boreus TaxID=120213 RepID=A0A3E0VAQ1_9MICO|nr:hypothetical protein B7R54_18735 [Subtercola boreus]TQL46861.1 hypothetical protein FB464_3855 [Subtercola boreus]